MMIHCVICGQRFHAEEKFHTCCPECMMDGIDWSDQKFMSVLRGLSVFVNSDWPKEQKEFIAGTFGFTELVKDVMPTMEAKSFKNMLHALLKELR